MSAEAGNVAILRKAYEGWSGSNAADIDCWLEIIAEDARLTSLPAGAGFDSATGRSAKSEIIDYLVGMTVDWEMIFHRIDEFIAEGDRVVAIGASAWRNRKSGKVNVTPKVDIWRMRDGKVIQFTEFRDLPRFCRACETLVEFGASPAARFAILVAADSAPRAPIGWREANRR